MKISMKLVYQYMAIFCTFSPTSNHLHPLQVENCDSNSRLVVDEDDNGKFRVNYCLQTVFTIEINKRLVTPYNVIQICIFAKCFPGEKKHFFLSNLNAMQYSLM